MRNRIAIIGAGMAGILSAIKLEEAGHSDYVVFEKAERLGGTWRENTYPGIACDVPSHLYSYSFAPNPDWSHRYSPGAEIQAYFERVAEQHAVRERIRFGARVASCVFRAGQWHLETEQGDREVFDFVIAATGVLHHPSIPEFPGQESFEGALFHSARWDHDVPLDGRRIGVIGTGSTAIQITCGLVDRVAQLSLFQRTAQWVMHEDNPPYTDAERAAFHEDPEILTRIHTGMSQRVTENFSDAIIDADSPRMKMIEQACLSNLEDNVRDPVLREQLRPDYRAACKRLVFSPDFYSKIQRDNAELVVEGIEGIEPEGVRTHDGRLHPLDVLVLATGFRVDRFMRPMRILGRDGVDLDAVWADRPVAYLSISIPEFPNLFMLNGPNGPVGNFSLIEVAELQIAYVLKLIALRASGEATEISASRAATDRFDAERIEAAKHTVWATGCRSWYLDAQGIPATWPFPFTRFRAEMAAPRLDDFDLRR
jgi:cation diffusion facilitator CzcD-associated flavoprotein CzcO